MSRRTFDARLAHALHVVDSKPHTPHSWSHHAHRGCACLFRSLARAREILISDRILISLFSLAGVVIIKKKKLINKNRPTHTPPSSRVGPKRGRISRVFNEMGTIFKERTYPPRRRAYARSFSSDFQKRSGSELFIPFAQLRFILQIIV